MTPRYVEAPDETTLDDIWTDQGGVSLRVVKIEHGLRIEFTRGVAEEATTFVTLTGYRAHRLGQVLAKAFPKP